MSLFLLNLLKRVAEKNRRPIAQIIPIEESLEILLEEQGLLGNTPDGAWKELKLNLIQISAEEAVQAIFNDREL